MDHDAELKRQYADKEREARTPVDTMSTAGQCSKPPEEFIIRELFTYHPPDLRQQKCYASLRSAAKHLAEVICENVPEGADRTDAIRKLRECIMTANAGIALKGLSF